MISSGPRITPGVGPQAADTWGLWGEAKGRAMCPVGRPLDLDPHNIGSFYEDEE